MIHVLAVGVDCCAFYSIPPQNCDTRTENVENSQDHFDHPSFISTQFISLFVHSCVLGKNLLDYSVFCPNVL